MGGPRRPRQLGIRYALFAPNEAGTDLRKPAICEQYSYCLVTRSWRVPCVISGSRLMMRSPSRSRSNFSPAQGCGPTNPRAAAHPRSRFTSCYVHPKTSAGWAESGELPTFANLAAKRLGRAPKAVIRTAIPGKPW
jgi:hypothetical protein